MNQVYDEPMERVSVSIQQWLHNGIKELGVKTSQKKGTLMRKLMYMGYAQLLEATDDRVRKDRAIGDTDTHVTQGAG